MPISHAHRIDFSREGFRASRAPSDRYDDFGEAGARERAGTERH